MYVVGWCREVEQIQQSPLKVICTTDKKLQYLSSDQGGVGEMKQPGLGSFHSLLWSHCGL